MPDGNTHLVCRRLNASLSRKILVMSLHFSPQATHVGSPAIRSTLMADRSSELGSPRRSSCGSGLFSGPAELGAVNPYAVHDHSQPACQGHEAQGTPGITTCH